MSNYKSLSKNISEQITYDKEHHSENPYAFKDANVIRRFAGHDTPSVWRPPFVMDVEKILHNPFYNRYADKTQVMSLYKNDDLSRRLLHVQLVSRTARTIGMALNLNLDLVEAIALGHDIGHTPFGHAGEKYLNAIYHERTGRLFNHNVHSVRVLDKLVRRNISLQVLDGVICHNGEMEQQNYSPIKLDDFATFDANVESCYTDPDANKRQCPSTLEGCVMRISDIIAYLGKDRQDAINAGLLSDYNSFSEIGLGATNAEIINNMTVSIIENSYGKPFLSIDKEVFDAFSLAKKENYEIIYNSKETQVAYKAIEQMFKLMYDELYNELIKKDTNSIIYRHHIECIRRYNQYSRYGEGKTSDIDCFIQEYLSQDANEIVVDYIASMTDDYFIDLFAYLFPESKLKVNYIGYFD